MEKYQNTLSRRSVSHLQAEMKYRNMISVIIVNYTLLFPPEHGWNNDQCALVTAGWYCVKISADRLTELFVLTVFCCCCCESIISWRQSWILMWWGGRSLALLLHASTTVFTQEAVIGQRRLLCFSSVGLKDFTVTWGEPSELQVVSMMRDFLTSRSSQCSLTHLTPSCCCSSACVNRGSNIIF